MIVFPILSIYSDELTSNVREAAAEFLRISPNLKTLGYSVDSGKSIFGFIVDSGKEKKIPYNFGDKEKYLITASADDSSRIIAQIEDITSPPKNETNFSDTSLCFYEPTNDGKRNILIKNYSANAAVVIVIVLKISINSIYTPVDDVYNAIDSALNNDISPDEIINTKRDFFIIGGNIKAGRAATIDFIINKDDRRITVTGGDTVSELGLKIYSNDTVALNKKKAPPFSLEISDVYTDCLAECRNLSPRSYGDGVAVVTFFNNNQR